MADIDGEGRIGYDSVYIPDSSNGLKAARTDMASLDISHTEMEEDTQSEYNSEQYIVDENVSFSSYNGTSSSRSQSPTRNQFCRICHEKNHTERNISPCRCRGTLAMVHKSCLEQWLVASDSNKCELCGHKFSVLRKPKYSLLKSLWIWLTDPSTARDRGNAVKDFMNVAFAVPLLFVMNHLTYVNTGEDVLDESDIDAPWYNETTSPMKIILTLLMISTLGFLNGCFAMWSVLHCDKHFRKWYRWYRRQCTVTLQEASDMH